MPPDPQPSRTCGSSNSRPEEAGRGRGAAHTSVSDDSFRFPLTAAVAAAPPATPPPLGAALLQPRPATLPPLTMCAGTTYAGTRAERPLPASGPSLPSLRLRLQQLSRKSSSLTFPHSPGFDVEPYLPVPQPSESHHMSRLRGILRRMPSPRSGSGSSSALRLTPRHTAEAGPRLSSSRARSAPHVLGHSWGGGERAGSSQSRSPTGRPAGWRGVGPMDVQRALAAFDLQTSFLKARVDALVGRGSSALPAQAGPGRRVVAVGPPPLGLPDKGRITLDQAFGSFKRATDALKRSLGFGGSAPRDTPASAGRLRPWGYGGKDDGCRASAGRRGGGGGTPSPPQAPTVDTRAQVSQVHQLQMQAELLGRQVLNVVAGACQRAEPRTPAGTGVGADDESWAWDDRQLASERYALPPPDGPSYSQRVLSEVQQALLSFRQQAGDLRAPLLDFITAKVPPRARSTSPTPAHSPPLAAAASCVRPPWVSGGTPPVAVALLPLYSPWGYSSPTQHSPSPTLSPSPPPPPLSSAVGLLPLSPALSGPGSISGSASLRAPSPAVSGSGSGSASLHAPSLARSGSGSAGLMPLSPARSRSGSMSEGRDESEVSHSQACSGGRGSGPGPAGGGEQDESEATMSCYSQAEGWSSAQLRISSSLHHPHFGLDVTGHVATRLLPEELRKCLFDDPAQVGPQAWDGTATADPDQVGPQRSGGAATADTSAPPRSMTSLPGSAADAGTLARPAAATAPWGLLPAAVSGGIHMSKRPTSTPPLPTFVHKGLFSEPAGAEVAGLEASPQATPHDAAAIAKSGAATWSAAAAAAAASLGPGAEEAALHARLARARLANEAQYHEFQVLKRSLALYQGPAWAVPAVPAQAASPSLSDRGAVGWRASPEELSTPGLAVDGGRLLRQGGRPDWEWTPQGQGRAQAEGPVVHAQQRQPRAALP